MKISDLLRDFADARMLQAIADSIDTQHELEKQLAVASATKPTPIINAPEGSPPPPGVMASPLQLTLGALKKANGVEEVSSEEEEEIHSYPNLVSQMCRNAGIDSNLINQLSKVDH